MNEVDKKSITPAYEYKVDGYRYQLMQDIAFEQKAAVDNLVETLTHLTTSESEMISLTKMLEDEVREREAKIADLTSENLYLGDEVSNRNSDVERLHRIIDHKDSLITGLTCENKALNKEKEDLRQEIDILKSKAELSGSVAEDIEKLKDSLYVKDKWINSLKEENKSLLMFRNHLFEQLLFARREIESLKEQIDILKSGEQKED